MNRLGTIGTISLLVALASPATRAWGASGQDIATAQALFDEGKRLMKAGNFAEACPKLSESQRLDPGAGTMLALALCHESEGKTASAWAEFSEVLSDARRDHRGDREAAAQQHLKVLEQKLTRVVVTVVGEVPGIEVKRDGASLGKAQWGVPLPVDPGTHTFEATAPGKTPWKATGDLSGEGKTLEVRVPALQDLPAAPPAPTTAPVATIAPPPTSSSSTSTAPPPPAPSNAGSSQRTAGLIVGGAGVLVAGIGTYFGIHASSLWSSAHTACPGDKCTRATDVTKGQDAGSAADTASVLLGVGAVAVIAGVVLYFTAPTSTAAPAEKPSTARVHWSPTLGGFAVWGTL